MTTEAGIGYGSLFEISTDGGSTWTSIGEVIGITPPGDTVDIHDATHMQSPNATREFIAGLRDPGECSVELNFVPGSAGDLKAQAVRDARAPASCRITFANGVAWSFMALLTAYQPETPLDDKMTASLTFKVTGSYTPAAAAAPTNSVLPAIAGTAQDGVALTALPGIWAGAPVFSYQWQTDGGGSFADIPGATAATYAPATADVGDTLRVVVTGANGAGSASATSAATAAVLAA